MSKKKPEPKPTPKPRKKREPKQPPQPPAPVAPSPLPDPAWMDTPPRHLPALDDLCCCASQHLIEGFRIVLTLSHGQQELELWEGAKVKARGPAEHETITTCLDSLIKSASVTHE